MHVASLSVVIGDGADAMLWTDNWLPVGPLHHFAPTLFAATSMAGRKRKVREALQDHRWAADITGAPTTQVLCEYFRVWDLLAVVQLQPLQSDRFFWKWSADRRYSVSSTYRAFFHGSTSMLGAKELWSIRVPPRVKFFFWLALQERLWTADRRKRHGLQDGDECAFCAQEAETMPQLLLGCYFARQVWYALLHPLQLDTLIPAISDGDDVASWWVQQRMRIDNRERKFFDSLLLLIAWCLWKERNARVFGRASANVDGVVKSLLRESEDWALGGFRLFAELNELWSRHLGSM